MKFKITYGPHIRKSVTKKFISTTLTIGLLFSSTLPSFASILSEDCRYETFEGNNIAIDNVLEEDTVDVEIEGNTLVNLIDYSLISSNHYSYNDGYIGEIVSDNRSWSSIVPVAVLKPNTTYTVVLEGFNTLDEAHIGYNLCWMARLNKEKTVFTTSSSITNGFIFKMHGSNTRCRIMLLEGDWTNKEVPEYFEGMKSVGENNVEGHNIEINAKNKNLLDINNLEAMIYSYDLPFKLENSNTIFNVNQDTISYAARNNWNIGVGGVYKVKKNTLYTAKYEEATCDKNYNMSINIIGLYENELNIKYWTSENYQKYTSRLKNFKCSPSERNVSLTYDSKDYDYLVIYIGGNWILNPTETRTITLKNVGIYETDNKNVEYERYNSNNIKILLNEPLRRLPNGVKDRVIKKNGQWVVERNIKEIMLTGSGSENWGLGNDNVNIASNNTISFQRNFNDIAYERNTGIQLMSELFPSYEVATASTITEDKEWIRSYSTTSGNVGIRILKSKLTSPTIEGFREWLSNNNLKVIYQLKEPVYESLNIASTINLYKDATYISNNCNIPANMKIMVDRVANRAKEAIELMEIKPTIENLSQSRYWSNLMKESVLKDSFQSKINNITNVKDLTIEKKSATVNADIYIKPKNTLSLSIDTNSIMFDEVDTTENTEMLNAVNLTVNSSLPYKVNAYLEEEIYNSDRSQILDKSALNIKANNKNEYKVFADLSSPLTLLDDQDAGTNNIHGVDLKLTFNTAHKADIYKTTIKFEAEQK